MVESEFGHHEDGLPNLGEHADEVHRLAENTRKRGKKFTPLEEFPSREPDPLEALIAKEDVQEANERARALGEHVANEDAEERWPGLSKVHNNKEDRLSAPSHDDKRK